MKLEHLFFEGLAAPRRRPASAARPRTWIAQPAVPIDAEAEQFLRQIFAAPGLCLDAYRARALMRRVSACLRYLRVNSVREASARLERDERLRGELLNVVLLGVTGFFRDTTVFHALEREVIPELARKTERLRIWSAACSDGLELYSIAMLLAEKGWLRSSELLGTDLRSTAIDRARAGIFGVETLENLEPRWRDVYLQQNATTVAVAPFLRQAVRWVAADLLQEVAPGPWHLLLWRNMAIYLDGEVADTLWARLCAEVADGGFLVVGKADRPPKRLPLVRVAPCIFQKRIAG